MHQQRPSGSKGVMSRHLRPWGSSSNRTRSYVKRRFSYPKPSHLTQRDAADGKFGNRGRFGSFQKTFAERELRLTVVFCSVTTRTPKGGIKQCLSPEFVCKRITRRFPACAPLSTTSKRRNRSWGERQLVKVPSSRVASMKPPFLGASGGPTQARRWHRPTLQNCRTRVFF